MLKDMGEHKSLWFALRKHGDSDQVLKWLSILHDHSNWQHEKTTQDEKLRKEYLSLLDQIRYFDPSFRDS